MVFNGPLFIVGLPRSGTKLLRDLLNQNPAISIPHGETHFIPAFAKAFNYQPPSDEQELKKFFALFKEVNFFHRMLQNGYQLSEEKFLDNVRPGNWHEIIFFILKFYGKQKNNNQVVIYGDKTPQYLRYLKLLLKLFPNARIVHIIRDPRDYCVSIKNIWGKNMYRAAHYWCKEINEAQKQFASHKSYLEVTYEELIKHPKECLTRICLFTECPFDIQMLTLSKPSENYGDTKNNTAIIATNSEKYFQRLSQNQIKRIEEITYPVLLSKAYPVNFANQHVPLTKLQLAFYRMADIMALAAFHIKEKGFSGGINFVKRAYRFKI